MSDSVATIQAPDAQLLRITLTDRQVVYLHLIRTLPVEDRYPAKVRQIADQLMKRTTPSSMALSHTSIQKLERCGLIASERESFASGRGQKKRWLTITSLGNRLLDYHSARIPKE